MEDDGTLHDSVYSVSALMSNGTVLESACPLTFSPNSPGPSHPSVHTDTCLGKRYHTTWKNTKRMILIWVVTSLKINLLS